jgi:hypothetical protein
MTCRVDTLPTRMKTWRRNAIATLLLLRTISWSRGIVSRLSGSFWLTRLANGYESCHNCWTPEGDRSDVNRATNDGRRRLDPVMRWYDDSHTNAFYLP